jgi:hypothetical protein
MTGISGVATIPNSKELAANVDATLHCSINRLLKAKLPRMAKLTGYDRKLLLIWNDIPFADANDVQSYFTAHQPSGIDAIFFVEGGKGNTSLLLDSGLKL